MGDTYLVVDGVYYDLVLRDEETNKREFHGKVGSSRSSSIQELDDEPAPCPDHPNKKLYHKSGKYGTFWSHKNDDGSYHNIKDQS